MTAVAKGGKSVDTFNELAAGRPLRSSSRPGWTIPNGTVLDSRELTAAKEKGGAVFAYSIRIEAMGGTFDVQTKDLALFKAMKPGMVLDAHGTFEQAQYTYRLILRDFDPIPVH